MLKRLQCLFRGHRYPRLRLNTSSCLRCGTDPNHRHLQRLRKKALKRRAKAKQIKQKLLY